MRKSSLFFFLLLFSIPLYALGELDKDNDGKFTKQEIRALQNEFRQINGKLANTQDHRNNVDVSTVTASHVEAATLDVTSMTVNTQSFVYVDWTSYTPTLTGFGTTTPPTGIVASYQIIGNTMYVYGYFISGHCATSEASISLPTGYIIDTSKLHSIGGGVWLGEALQLSISGAMLYYSSFSGLAIYYQNPQTGKVFVTWRGEGGIFLDQGAAYWMTDHNALVFKFSVPVKAQ